MTFMPVFNRGPNPEEECAARAALLRGCGFVRLTADGVFKFAKATGVPQGLLVTPREVFNALTACRLPARWEATDYSPGDGAQGGNILSNVGWELWVPAWVYAVIAVSFWCDDMDFHPVDPPPTGGAAGPVASLSRMRSYAEDTSEKRGDNIVLLTRYIAAVARSTTREDRRVLAALWRIAQDPAVIHEHLVAHGWAPSREGPP